MSNDQAKNYFDQGVAFYEKRDYEPALQKFETALSQVDSWDTQLREDIRKIIEEVKICARNKREADRAGELADELKRSLYAMTH